MVSSFTLSVASWFLSNRIARWILIGGLSVGAAFLYGYLKGRSGGRAKEALRRAKRLRDRMVTHEETVNMHPDAIRRELSRWVRDD